MTITRNIVTFDELLESIQIIIRKRNIKGHEKYADRFGSDAPDVLSGDGLSYKAEIFEQMPILNDAEIKTLQEKYDYIMEMMNRYVPEGAETNDSKINIWFGPFTDGRGYQFIAEGSVSDFGRPIQDQWNWHLQNTSQWLFAFGFVFDTERRDFSIHT